MAANNEAIGLTIVHISVTRPRKTFAYSILEHIDATRMHRADIGDRKSCCQDFCTHLLNNTTLCANWSLPWGVLRSYLGGTRFTYPAGRELGHSLVPIRITARVIPLQKKLFPQHFRTNMADWLRFHFVIARRRYTGSSAPADSADCRFGDMARGEGGREGRRAGGREGGRREGGMGGEGRGGEGRGGEGRGGEGRGGEGRGLSTLSTNQNLCDHGALAGHPFRGWPASSY